MKVARIDARYIVGSVRVPVTEKVRDVGVLLVTIETDTGLTGIGVAREHDKHCRVVRELVTRTIAPFIQSTDPLSPEHVWHEAAWNLSRGDFRMPFGAVSRAISAVDQALWDIRGQHYGQPVYKLLGGAQAGEIDVYLTFGLDTYSLEEETEAARRLLAQGHTAFKLVSSAEHGSHDVERDVARVKALRESAGDSARIMIDGRNCFDVRQAKAFARRIAPYNVTYFDEPIIGRDVAALAELRRGCPEVPIAARGWGGNLWSNRDLIAKGAVDLLGSNVLDGGGFTQSVKAAHMAEMYQLPLVTGGGWHPQNAHLIAAVSNGWMTEVFILSGLLCETIFVDVPKPVKSRLRLNDHPGLGFKLNEDAVREAIQRGLAAERRT